MAKLVFGIGLSHSPMMALPGDRWKDFAVFDYQHPALYDEDGNHVNYAELEQKRNARYGEEMKDANLIKQWQDMRAAFQRLRRDLEHFAPDALLVIGNEHGGETLSKGRIIPALAVYTGDTIISEGAINHPISRKDPEIGRLMAKGLGMDGNHEWPGSSDIAIRLVTSLMEQGFDSGVIRKNQHTLHGHAWGTVVVELMPEKQIPMVPIHLNTFPPNQIPPSRCYDLGRAIRRAVEEMPDHLRIGLIASGGLSHFVTDVDIDRQVLAALKSETAEQELRSLPRHRLKAGSSEIRNWIILKAACEDMQLDWDEYIPVFRTLAGTGMGMAFARFS
jgi:3-O-methylgallate 3,4-dioxygenase